MMEKKEGFEREFFLEIKLETGDELKTGGMVGQFNSFRVLVVTDKRVFIMEGCHDCDPEIAEIPLEKVTGEILPIKVEDLKGIGRGSVFLSGGLGDNDMLNVEFEIKKGEDKE
jgi:hypothetical protein